MVGRTAIGVDVGGTGIKGAVVDLDAGELLSDRVRIDTPQPATPEAVRSTIGEVLSHIEAFMDGPTGSVGVALPGVIQHGVVRTAANIDPTWIGTSLVDLFDDVALDTSTFLNDADAAALAEVAYGAARDHRGLVITVTFGTGIGVGLVHDGRLVPNAELGHLELDGHEAESIASARARKDADLTWEEWGVLASRYLQHLENLLWPDLYVIGGGVAKSPEKWLPHLATRTPLRPATLINNAGIVGAAYATLQPPARG